MSDVYIFKCTLYVCGHFSSPRVDGSSRSVCTVTHQSQSYVELHWGPRDHRKRTGHRISGQLAHWADQQSLCSSAYQSGKTYTFTHTLAHSEQTTVKLLKLIGNLQMLWKLHLVLFFFLVNPVVLVCPQYNWCSPCFCCVENALTCSNLY